MAIYASMESEAEEQPMREYDTVYVGNCDYSTFVDLVLECKSKDNANREIVINFKDVSFLLPYHIVILACIVENLITRGIKVHFRELKDKLRRYLNDIRFLQYWEPGFNRDAYTVVRIETTLCLWHISETMIFQYADYARRYYETNFFKGLDLDSLHINLCEVFNNIFDHANSPINGYVFTQYYPAKNVIIIAICDFGVGIPKKVNDYRIGLHLDELPDNEAIIEALKDGFTTKSTEKNKGIGLCTVLNIVRSLNGRLKIVSNKGFYTSETSQKEASSLIITEGFPGCLIWIELDSTKFEKREIENNGILEF
jgi:anti-sigma regulatory factor (Ser/Thr protein kinase)